MRQGLLRFPSLLASLVVLSNTSLSTAGQAPQTETATAPTAGGLISKMFLYYTNATNVSGSIISVQEAQGHSITTETRLQYSRPSKIYLKQTRQGGDGKTFMLTSDGITFSYDAPARVYGRNRLTEYTQTQYRKLDITDMYAATLQSILDENEILSIAIARKLDLVRLTRQLIDYKIVSSVKEGSETVYQITGRIAPDIALGSKAWADYEMFISETGAFRKFATRQVLQVPGHPEMPPVTVNSTWTSSLTVGGSIDPSLYRTVR